MIIMIRKQKEKDEKVIMAIRKQEKQIEKVLILVRKQREGAEKIMNSFGFFMVWYKNKFVMK